MKFMKWCFKKGMVFDMAKVYADLIRKGLKTIDDVPEQLRDEVQAILDGDS